jgi:perosamine synthetase
VNPPGLPQRSSRPLPYGRQWIDEDDIAAVVEVLRSDWLTTGPKVEEFEAAFAAVVGARAAVAVSSGTAALHAAMFALGIEQGDEVIVPAMTFAATANCVVYQGGTPVFADIDPDTLLLNPIAAAALITPRTRAIVAVDFAGQPCAYDALSELARRHRLALVSDACHSLGGKYRGRPSGSLADLSTFSFHPVKPITTCEGGMITTDDAALARRMQAFRNHGISTDHRQRERAGSWYYEMVELGYNYRLNDLQCALGLSQLQKLPDWISRRQEIARRYDAAFAGLEEIRPLTRRVEVSHAYHLYVVRMAGERDRVFAALREQGIGVNVHYLPVHLHPYYRRRFGTGPGLCPVAEAAPEDLLSLPIFPRMSNQDVDDVITALLRSGVGKSAHRGVRKEP